MSDNIDRNRNILLATIAAALTYGAKKKYDEKKSESQYRDWKKKEAERKAEEQRMAPIRQKEREEQRKKYELQWAEKRRINEQKQRAAEIQAQKLRLQTQSKKAAEKQRKEVLFRQDPSGSDTLSNEIWNIEDVLKVESESTQPQAQVFRVPSNLEQPILNPFDAWLGYEIFGVPGLSASEDIPMVIQDHWISIGREDLLPNSNDTDDNSYKEKIMAEWKKWVKSYLLNALIDKKVIFVGFGSFKDGIRNGRNGEPMSLGRLIHFLNSNDYHERDQINISDIPERFHGDYDQFDSFEGLFEAGFYTIPELVQILNSETKEAKDFALYLATFFGVHFVEALKNFPSRILEHYGYPRVEQTGDWIEDYISIFYKAEDIAEHRFINGSFIKGDLVGPSRFEGGIESWEEFLRKTYPKFYHEIEEEHVYDEIYYNVTDRFLDDQNFIISSDDLLKRLKK
jgi:hypothetical protein